MAKPKQGPRRSRPTLIGVYVTPELRDAVDELARRRSTVAMTVTRGDVMRSALVAALNEAAISLAKVG